MKLSATSILLGACCVAVLTLPACSLRAARAAPPAAAAPKPTPPPPVVETAAEMPVSVPQTQVTLPNPQPIQAEALAVRPETQPVPDPANLPVRPPRNPTPPRTEARPQAQPAGPAAPPPVAPAVTRRRIRPLESPAERQRLLAGITARQKQVQDVLAKAKSRQLSEAEKGAADRIQGFLAQTENALKDDDLQQAEALSNRALLLCQELNIDK